MSYINKISVAARPVWPYFNFKYIFINLNIWKYIFLQILFYIDIPLFPLCDHNNDVILCLSKYSVVVHRLTFYLSILYTSFLRKWVLYFCTRVQLYNMRYEILQSCSDFSVILSRYFLCRLAIVRGHIGFTSGVRVGVGAQEP